MHKGFERAKIRNEGLTDYGSTKRNARYLQYVTAITAGILHASQFANLAWGSPALPRLLAGDSPIGRPITHEEASWVVSVTHLGLMIGGALLLVVLDRLGSRNILLAAASLTILSWTLLVLAKSVTTLIIGRIIAGISDGISLPSISIYICEIASKDIRGRLGAIPPLIGVFGNIFVLSAGPFLEYTTLVVSCTVFPVMFIVLFWFMPKSPYFLIKNNNKKDAELNLMRLLGARSPTEVANEFREIDETIKHETCGLTLVQIMRSPKFRKSLLIVFVAQSIGSFCGMHFIIAYLQIILASGGISMSKELTSVVFGLVQIPAVVLYGVFMDKFGRKPTFCVSALGASIALISEGIYIYLTGIVDLSNVTFIPVICITSYQFFICLGMIYLPHFIVGELFTIETKKVGSSIMTMYSSFIVFMNVKVFGGKFDSWGFHTIFWVYGGVCLLGVFFSLFMLPETKGKSFTEIQNGMSSHNKNSDCPQM